MAWEHPPGAGWGEVRAPAAAELVSHTALKRQNCVGWGQAGRDRVVLCPPMPSPPCSRPCALALPRVSPCGHRPCGCIRLGLCPGFGTADAIQSTLHPNPGHLAYGAEALLSFFRAALPCIAACGLWAGIQSKPPSTVPVAQLIPPPGCFWGCCQRHP